MRGEEDPIINNAKVELKIERIKEVSLRLGEKREKERTLISAITVTSIAATFQVTGHQLRDSEPFTRAFVVHRSHLTHRRLETRETWAHCKCTLWPDAICALSLPPLPLPLPPPLSFLLARARWDVYHWWMNGEGWKWSLVASFAESVHYVARGKSRVDLSLQDIKCNKITARTSTMNPLKLCKIKSKAKRMKVNEHKVKKDHMR